MSDDSVRAALRSNARIVLIEAPAGCGKTYQGADYARDASARVGNGMVLVLTHTHAACDVFAAQTHGVGRIDIRTIDSLVCHIAGAYHLALGLPRDASAWAREMGGNGYEVLSGKVASLLRLSPYIAEALAKRYPIIVCDEHQDSGVGQHAVTMALHKAGAFLRVFGDTMQRIYHKGDNGDSERASQQWCDLRTMASAFDKLETPHRWRDGAVPLGDWLLEARESLSRGGQVDLRRRLPAGLTIVVAENLAPNYGAYRLGPEDRRPIGRTIGSFPSLLILSGRTKTVAALRSCFARRLPIWEGHTRDGLAHLVANLRSINGDAPAVSLAMIRFVQCVATGFSPSAYSDVFHAEVEGGCISKRSGKPQRLQELAGIILTEPNHRGVAKILRRLNTLIACDSAFKQIKVDHKQEFWDAVTLGEFDNADAGFAEITRRRTHARPSPASQAISTIHKAKGMECDNVLVIPCDASHFPDSNAARCLLYVAMSRAKQTLTLVVSRRAPSPLIMI
jgi:UvrD-like helicase family protein/AAA domain-containing protein